jgi:hypothetical protein
MKREQLYISIPEATALEPEEYTGLERAIALCQIKLKNRRIQLYRRRKGIAFRFKRYLPSIKRITVSELDLTDEAAAALLQLLLLWAERKVGEQ